MTRSVQASAFRPLSLAPPAVARFHAGSTIDGIPDIQSPNSSQRSLETTVNPAVRAQIGIAFGSFRLFPARFLLLENDKPVHLGSRALEILGALLERPGELVSKKELMDRVWPDVFVEPANLSVHMSALRRTLRDGRDGHRFIINVPGRGYSFVASVELLEKVN